jgi:ribosomal protein L12E/L44/L45/RPP1/RPP2
VRQESVVDPVVENDDEPLFVDDLSDFDMDEILAGTQKQNETRTGEAGTDEVVSDETNMNESGKYGEKDEFEDEMDAMNDMDDFF